MKPDRLSAAVALAAGIALAAFVASRISFLSSMPRPLANLYLGVADDGVALAPDGRALAYTVERGGDSLLELRRVDDGEIRRLARAKRARRPFFSPDGRFLAFLDSGALRRVFLDSYEVETSGSLADVEDGCFLEDESILAASRGGLFRLSPAGEAVQILPDRVHAPLAIGASEWIVFEARDEDGSELQAFSLASGARRKLLPRASLPRLSPSGHLLFLRGSALWASRFDATKAEVIGSPAVVIADVDWFDVAENGTLAFLESSRSRPALRIILNWDKELRSRMR